MSVTNTFNKLLAFAVTGAVFTGLVASCSPQQSATPSASSQLTNTVHTVSTASAPVVHPSATHTAVVQVQTATAHTTVMKTLPHTGVQIPILEYHDITYIPKDPWTMSATQFADEMQFLAGHGFHAITLDQFYAAKYHGAKLPARPVVITFDDGYESNYNNAFPVLQQYGFHATIFMISSFIGRHGFLTLQELQDMQNSGLVAIESHTVHHKDLSKLTSLQTMNELVQSKQTLTQDLHHPVLYFCYPDGGFKSTTLWYVQKAGYLLATTTNQGYTSLSDNPYLLKRIAIHEDVPLTKFAQLLAPSFGTHV